MILWWHLSKMLASTPYFEITFWLLQNIRSIHDIELFITFGLFNHLCIHCWWCERIYFCTCWIRNVVFPLIFSTSIKISSNNWTERKFIIHLAKKNIKIWAKDFKLFLALMRWAVSTGWKAFFALWSNFYN